MDLVETQIDISQMRVSVNCLSNLLKAFIVKVEFGESKISAIHDERDLWKILMYESFEHMIFSLLFAFECDVLLEIIFGIFRDDLRFSIFLIGLIWHDWLLFDFIILFFIEWEVIIFGFCFYLIIKNLLFLFTKIDYNKR